ncbi:MAG TPA: hypothetical protein VH682_13810 [Gemmataceae bacterium]
MTDDLERLDADELAGRWLDEGTPPAEMDEAGRRRLAELQLLHGLLVHLHDRDAGARERRVHRVLQALKEPVGVLPHPAVRSGASGPRGRRQAQRIVSWLASAAAMLLIGLIVWKLVAPNPAYAVVQRAFEAAGLDQDRTYRVVDQWSGPRAGTREATLWVRGDRFVFQPERPLIPGLLLGSDGRQGWAVSDGGPVRVSDDPLEFFRVMTRGLLPSRRDGEKMPSREMVPLLQQRTLLRNLGQSYRLELLDPEPLANQDEIRYQHIRARRLKETPGGAEGVELWVHPQSSVIARLRLQAKRDLGERLVTLDLVSEKPLRRDWYNHSAHHEAGRPVKDWLPGELPPGDIPPPKENGKP